MNKLIKNFAIVILVLLAVSSIFALLYKQTEPEKEISITQLATDINENAVKKIVVSANNLSITYIDKDKLKAKSKKEDRVSLFNSLTNLGVSKEKFEILEIEIKEKKETSAWLIPIVSIALPLLILILFFWLISRQAKSGVMQTFNFTKSKARIFNTGAQNKEKTTFDDVAGLKEAKEELNEIVDFLKNPKKYLQMGAKIPRGVLLIGAPGTGKTLLAKAVASESNVPFFSISGSEFVEMFVGVGSARVRDLFSMAKKQQPSIIFIDELDAIGRLRGAGIGGGHDEREQTLNQILVEMDGFERESTTLVFAATNRPDVLDPALLRPGRFDRRVTLDLPDIEDRKEILKIHSQKKPMASNVKLREIAERTPGFSGADLGNLVNESAILAAKKNKKQIFQEELLESIEKVMLGPERKSHILSKKEKEITAYHEAGHALVSSFLPNTEPIRKISIVARGMAAGYTLKMPIREKQLKTKSDFLSDLSVLLGGYCAEKIKFGEMTTGASNDLKKASEIARKLVKEYGMSSLGPISFGEKEEMVFLGKEISEERNYSEKIAERIDNEIARFMNEAEKQTKKILTEKRNILDKIAKRLVEKETIEKEEFENLIKLKKGKQTRA
ncbi:MAG: ATP-dependent zinc metalloprotease FtsH [Patescibacteria group bacterium]|nr:ATP-dependent zinc metalloprotease FtsH [Patescibacteria group bacterium]